eukprot:symbB.v1.2.019379.t1/scaffold1582.1/size178113/14
MTTGARTPFWFFPLLWSQTLLAEQSLQGTLTVSLQEYISLYERPTQDGHRCVSASTMALCQWELRRRNSVLFLTLDQETLYFQL